MDTNKIREQFEAAFVEEMCRRGGEGFRPSVLYSLSQMRPDGDYQHIIESLAWWAWQASSESVHIDDIKPEVAELMQRIKDQEREQLFRAEGFVRGSGRASISALQRHFKIGYGAACRLMERLELSGVVAAPDADGRRRVLPMVAP
ncbi:DNA translocase FtsK [Pseudomonas guariconensis]|uniref:DNA translocase FtsK n=1 Tax=Pseudomonas guariconensis TaxID=1288410 RepID=UPI00387192AA